jgi:hypothetical protein
VSAEAGHVAHWYAEEQDESLADALQRGAESASVEQMKLGMSRARARGKRAEQKSNIGRNENREKQKQGQPEKMLLELERGMKEEGQDRQ